MIFRFRVKCNRQSLVALIRFQPSNFKATLCSRRFISFSFYARVPLGSGLKDRSTDLSRLVERRKERNIKGCHFCFSFVDLPDNTRGGVESGEENLNFLSVDFSSSLREVTSSETRRKTQPPRVPSLDS